MTDIEIATEPDSIESNKTQVKTEESINQTNKTSAKSSPWKILGIIAAAIAIILICCCCSFFFFISSGITGSDEFKEGYCEGLEDNPDPFGIC